MGYKWVLKIFSKRIVAGNNFVFNNQCVYEHHVPTITYNDYTNNSRSYALEICVVKISIITVK